mgnify:CR=1 FL=1
MGSDANGTSGVSKLFRAYRLYNNGVNPEEALMFVFQSSFELTGYITAAPMMYKLDRGSFKALSSLQVI